MTELRALRFGKLGFIRFRDDNPNHTDIVDGCDFLALRELVDEKTPTLQYSPPRHFMASHWYKDPYRSSNEMYSSGLQAWRNNELESLTLDEAGQNRGYQIQGLFLVYALILEYFPHGLAKYEPADRSEIFTLSQTDFNLQNIFVDDQGDVTGIINWDLSETKPRYMGWSRTPCWLNEDLDPHTPDFDGRYSWPARMIHSPLELKRYREDYARYLVEGCGDDHEDLKYTLNSHKFDAIIWAIGNRKKMFRVLVIILDAIIGRVKWYDHLASIGSKGLPPNLEHYYRKRFQEYLNCSPPKVKEALDQHDRLEEFHHFVAAKNEEMEAYVSVNKTQRDLLKVYQAQFKQLQSDLVDIKTSQLINTPSFMDDPTKSLDLTLHPPTNNIKTRIHAKSVPSNERSSTLRALPGGRQQDFGNRHLDVPNHTVTRSNSSTRGLPTSSLEITFVQEVKQASWYDKIMSLFKVETEAAASSTQDKEALIGSGRHTCSS